MADTGWLSASAGFEDLSGGSATWAFSASQLITEDGSTVGAGGGDVGEGLLYVQLATGGARAGDQKVFPAFNETLAFQTVGGPTDKWGLVLPLSDVNATNFGGSLKPGYTADYAPWILTNFNASIPEGATIDGVEMRVKASLVVIEPGYTDLQIDVMQLKVYYTAASAPAAVADLAVTPGDSQLTFTWSAPADNGSSITKYTLKNGGVLHTDNVMSPATVPLLNNGIEYANWTVTATNAIGESDPSNSVTGTPRTVPSAISDLACTPGVYKLTFTWSAPSANGAEITKYTLKKDGSLHTDNVTSPHEVSPLTSGAESNGWTVTATNEAGESSPSSSVGGTPTDPPPPTMPTGLAASLITTTSLRLTWTDNSDSESQFQLYKRLAGVGDFESIATTSENVEQYDVTDLLVGTAYDFRINAVNIGGSSSPTDLLNISTLDLTAPAAIDDLALEAGDGEVTLTWSAPYDGGSEITQYNLYLEGELHTEDVTSPLTLTGLDNGELAGPYTVTAVNAEGESEPSNEVSGTPTSGEDPDPPRSDDELNLTADEWAEYAMDFDRMQLDSGNGKIHLPCYDQDFIASIEAVLPPEILSRVVFGSRGGRGCVG